MKKKLIFFDFCIAFIVIAGFLFLYNHPQTIAQASPGDEESSNGENGDESSIPWVYIGTSHPLTVNESHTHTGAYASDENGDLDPYSWSFLSCPGNCPTLSNASGYLSGGTSANVSVPGPTFTPLDVGNYRLQLAVGDEAGNEGVGTIVEIATSSSPPVAYAGLDYLLVVGTAYTHPDASGSDSNGNLASYSWQFDSCPSTCPSLSGTTGSINGSLTIIPGPTFSPNVIGNYILRLTVNDTSGLNDTDTAMGNAVIGDGSQEDSFYPVPWAGPSDRIIINESHTHTGAIATDENGDLETYSWNFSSCPGNCPTLSNASGYLSGGISNVSVPGPTYTPLDLGNYELRLVVSDGESNQGVDTTTEIVSVSTLTAEPWFFPYNATVTVDMDSFLEGTHIFNDWSIEIDCKNDGVFEHNSGFRPFFDYYLADVINGYEYVCEYMIGVPENPITYTIKVKKTLRYLPVFFGDPIRIMATAEEITNVIIPKPVLLDVTVPIADAGNTYKIGQSLKYQSTFTWQADTAYYQFTLVKNGIVIALEPALRTDLTTSPETLAVEFIPLIVGDDYRVCAWGQALAEPYGESGGGCTELFSITETASVNLDVKKSTQDDSNYSNSATIILGETVDLQWSGVSVSGCEASASPNVNDWTSSPNKTSSSTQRNIGFPAAAGTYTLIVSCLPVIALDNSLIKTAHAQSPVEGTVTVTVEDEGVGPNLIAGNLDESPDPGEMGLAMTFTADIVNDGDEDAGDSTVRLRINTDGSGSNDGDYDVSFTTAAGPRAIGETTGVSFEDIWTPSSSGTRRFEVCADIDDDIEEGNETDNCDSKTFVVSGGTPDLVIFGDVTLSDYDPEVGKKVNIIATTKNIGTANASPSKTIVKVDEDDDGDWDWSKSKGIPNLNPDDTKRNNWNKSSAWTAVKGTHRIRVCADSDDDVIESDEDNNCGEDIIITVVSSSQPSARDLEDTPGSACIAPLQPTLSWIFEDADPDDEQTAYQITVDDQHASEFPELDTGKIMSSSESYTVPLNTLFFDEEYTWHVWVWDKTDQSSDRAHGKKFRIQLHAAPDPDFTWLPIDPFEEELISFTDQTSVFGGATIAAWSWIFPDGTPASSSGQNPSSTFESIGTKSVSLNVVDSDGFSCSVIKNIDMALPSPDFKEVR